MKNNDKIDRFWLCLGEYDATYVYLFIVEPQKGISESGSGYWYVKTIPNEDYPYEEWLGTRIPSWVMDELYRQMSIPKANVRGEGGVKLEFEGHPDQLFGKIGLSYNPETKRLEIE